MRKRDAGSAPAMGDRVAYVIVQVWRVIEIGIRPEREREKEKEKEKN